jgi:Tissue inhibitor of metalloproteinase
VLSTTILRLLLISVTLLFLVDKASACLCLGPRQLDGFHPCMTYWSADAVFTGQVVGMSYAQTDADGKPAPFSQKIFHFSIDKAFRGVEGRTAEVITNSSEASCGYHFIQGQRYFVYAQRGSDGKLIEFLCGPTVPLDKAARDLAYAEEVKGGVKGAWIVGAVVKHERGAFVEYGIRSRLAGIEVILEQGDQEGKWLASTVTNSDGVYEFRDLGVGTYHVRAAFPFGPREWFPAGRPKDHTVSIIEETRCQSESFVLTTSGSVQGRLVTPEGEQLPQQYLALIPVDETGKELSSSLSLSASSLPESGSYHFRNVVPGRYLVAVNPRNKPGKSDPVYPLMYYPGVISREQATVILVYNSRALTLDDFTLPRPLKERWFSGTVLFADRTPAAGARVILIDPNDRMTETNVMEVIADDQGRFRLKGYESFPYWLDAYVDSKSATQSRGVAMYAPPVQLSTSGSVAGIKLVISLSYRSQPYHSP